MSTIFTKIIDGEIPGRFVWKDEHCVAFLDIMPLSEGHLLLVPARRLTVGPTCRLSWRRTCSLWRTRFLVPWIRRSTRTVWL